ncbi:MAG: EamA family transporter RarD, partial [Deferribacteraceae bacterium]|nr:EamA family transporter RarD [Deferribacteraceae bacterium]
MQFSEKQTTLGFLSALGCFILWGSLPIYWNLLFHLPVLTILCYRVIWSWLFVALVISVTRQWATILRLLADKRTILLMLICGGFINFNWGMYIYTISAGHVMETSMGYYMNPLISAFAGAMFFNEHMSRLQKLAILLTLAGVIYMIAGYGRIPYFAIALAASFAIYGAVHKLIKVSVLESMFYEMSLSLLPALAFLLFFSHETSFWEQTPSMMGIIAISGPLTALPLMA